MESKKGAVELSMTTIIVIVIGVTLLILGLVFVRGIFTKAIGLSDDAFLQAEKEIQNQMGASQKLFVNKITPEIEPGGRDTLYVGVQNFGTETSASPFTVEAVPGSDGGSVDWFEIPDLGNLEPGDKRSIPILVKLPKGAPPGDSYTFNIIVKKGSEHWDQQAIIISVKEE